MTDDPPPTIKDELKGAAKLLAWIVGIGLVFGVLGAVMFWSGCIPRPS